MEKSMREDPKDDPKDPELWRFRGVRKAEMLNKSCKRPTLKCAL